MIHDVIFNQSSDLCFHNESTWSDGSLISLFTYGMYKMQLTFAISQSLSLFRFQMNSWNPIHVYVYSNMLHRFHVG